MHRLEWGYCKDIEGLFIQSRVTIVRPMPGMLQIVTFSDIDSSPNCQRAPCWRHRSGRRCIAAGAGVNKAVG